MAKNFPTIDLHQDLMLHIRARDFFKDQWQTNFEMLDKSSNKIVVATAFPMPPSENYYDPITNNLIEADFKAYVEHCEKDLRWMIVRTAGDLDEVLADPAKKGLLLHVEGLNVVDDSPESWQRLERWHSMGWRSLGIVWNLKNSLGGGAKDDTERLTALGSKTIDWLLQHNMVVDCAHMNEQTFWDSVEKLKGKPIYVSHGNSRSCCDSSRNYSDDQLRAIAKSGGVIGVFFPRRFVNALDKARIADVIKHVDHMRGIMGIDHIALGSDWGGIITGFVDGLESVDTLPLFWEVLSAAGYSDGDIEKIAFRNAKLVLERYLC